MTGILRRLAPLALALLAAGALLVLYRSHQGELQLEAEREVPVVAPSRVEQSTEAVVVALDSADARGIGLELAQLRPVSRVPDERLPGEVVADPERVAVLRAPVAGRLSVPDGAKWPSLGDQVPAGTDVAQVSDARPLGLPLSGVVTRVSVQPGAIVEAGQELLEVVDRSRPLVRITWSDRAGGAPRARVVLRPAGESTQVLARLVGPAPEADPVTRRAAYLFRADHAWPGASPGTPVVALVPEAGHAAAAGLLVPHRAVVQWEGFAWTYVKRGPDRFERVRVPTDRPAPGGWIAGAPLADGDSVVVTGAEELLSEEFRARITVGDESGE